MIKQKNRLCKSAYCAGLAALRPQDLVSHVRLHKEGRDATGPVWCHPCGGKFVSWAKLVVHLKQTTAGAPCKEWNDSDKWSSQLDEVFDKAKGVWRNRGAGSIRHKLTTFPVGQLIFCSGG